MDTQEDEFPLTEDKTENMDTIWTEEELPLLEVDTENMEGPGVIGESQEEGKRKKDDLSWVNTFEDLLELVGTRGPWNIMHFFVCTYALFVSPMTSMTYQFLGATPDYWCLVEPLIEANWTQQQILSFAIPVTSSGGYDSCHMYDYNYTAAAAMGYEAALDDLKGSTNHTIPCRARDFNHTQYQSTVVTEWDLVCERRALYSTTQSIMSAGTLLGSIVTGFFFDRYGRRLIVLIVLILYIIVANVIAFAPSVSLYITGRMVISFLNTGLYNGTFVMVMETCATRYRSVVGALSAMPWALGYMLTPAIAYFVRPWRWLTIALALPYLPALSYFWLLPESPRWLVQKRHYTRAVAVLSKAAKMNGKELPPEPLLLQAMTQITDNVDEEEVKKADCWTSVKSGVKHFFAVVVRPELRFRALVYILWVNGSLIYLGISLSATNISVDPYMYIFLGGLLEIPSYILLWPAIAYFGRRKIQAGLSLLCGIFIFTLMAFLLVPSAGSYSLLMTLSLSGKMAITAVYQLTWLYTTELFPTEYRSIALGQGLLSATFSGACTPYINDLLGEVLVWAPAAIFGCAAIVSTIVSLILPETKDSALPEMSSLVKKDRESRRSKKRASTYSSDETEDAQPKGEVAKSSGIRNVSYVPDEGYVEGS